MIKTATCRCHAYWLKTRLVYYVISECPTSISLSFVVYILSDGSLSATLC